MQKPFKPIVGYPFNERAAESNRLTFDTPEKVRQFLDTKYCGGCCFGTDNLLRAGVYRFMAFRYSFREHLKKWLVLMPDGHLCGYYAPSVGQLRAAAYLPRHAQVWPFPA